MVGFFLLLAMLPCFEGLFETWGNEEGAAHMHVFAPRPADAETEVALGGTGA